MRRTYQPSRTGRGRADRGRHHCAAAHPERAGHTHSTTAATQVRWCCRRQGARSRRSHYLTMSTTWACQPHRAAGGRTHSSGHHCTATHPKGAVHAHSTAAVTQVRWASRSHGTRSRRSHQIATGTGRRHQPDRAANMWAESGRRRRTAAHSERAARAHSTTAVAQILKRGQPPWRHAWRPFG